ncbi:MAG: methyl-accepting chemotaxis protein [Desulfuromonadaceae bacterium]|nr:methyl-accepting chemotaxis protein [Desulfuromonadaceae bacterium]MDD5105529.1 methyl-accepting chemotaxis protein [Desulfuromonadaceae bacterium]
MKSHASLFSLFGFLLGIAAPLGWIIIRMFFYYDPGLGFFAQIVQDITKDGEHFAQYCYMGGGTASVIAVLGYMIGKNGDELGERAVQLDLLHTEVGAQKEIFENRYKVLDRNIKNFHQISSRIQKSLNRDEVLLLCAEGLHNILGYERVNILMAEEGKTLRFFAAVGTDGFDASNVVLPIDASIGVINKCFQERKVFLIDNISHYSEDYHLKSPHNRLSPLRSKSFILCPIVVKNETVGIFAIDNKNSRRALNDSDVDTIILFADQVASAITRINLLASIDTLTSEMENSFKFLLASREQYSRNVNNLRDGVDSVADGTSIIASASEGVMSSIDETSSAVNEISVAIEQVTRNLDHLAGVVHQSASAMEQIHSTIGNVEQNAVLSHEVSNMVQARAEEGREVVLETIQALDEIKHSVGLSFDAIQRLVENSTRIENIVNVINDITKRTNLLALNASIIAAQAGEYGKSFGVVADEIRNLSLQTGHSTGEITSIIEEIMTESKTAASNIRTSRDLVQRGVELGESTGASLTAIFDSSNYSLDMTKQIKLATQEQVVSVQLVAHSMEEISTMTSQIFTASTDQAKATRSIAKSIETIKDMTHEMVQSTTQQVDDGKLIRRSVESVSSMVTEMFDNMEMRRVQSKDVVKELEQMKSQTSSI